MSDFSSIINNLNEQFSLKGNKIAEEQEAIERSLLVLQEKIPWYKPWEIFSHVKRVKRSVVLLATIASSCLAEVINLQENQLSMLEVQRAFQQQIDALPGEKG